MKQISTKQAQKNAVLAKIKDKLPKVCKICGKRANDLAHLLPKSTHAQYYTEPRNLVILCRDCHSLYDDHVFFRQKQTALIEQVRGYASEQEIYQYFRV